MQRYDCDEVTLLFDAHGYRDLLMPLVVERGLLRVAPSAIGIPLDPAPGEAATARPV